MHQHMHHHALRWPPFGQQGRWYNDSLWAIGCVRPAAVLRADVCISFGVMHGDEHRHAHAPCHVTHTHSTAHTHTHTHSHSLDQAHTLTRARARECPHSMRRPGRGPPPVPAPHATEAQKKAGEGRWHTAVGERDGGGGQQSGGLRGVQHSPTEREGRQHDEHRHAESPLQRTIPPAPATCQPAFVRSMPSLRTLSLSTFRAGWRKTMEKMWAKPTLTCSLCAPASNSSISITSALRRDSQRHELE